MELVHHAKALMNKSFVGRFANLVVIFLFSVIIIVAAVRLILSFWSDTALVAMEILQLAMLIFLVCVVLYVILKLVVERKLRLLQFCSDNGFVFEKSLRIEDQSGALFKKGRARKASNVISGNAAGNFTLFDYQYTTGSGKNSRRHSFGVVKLLLDKRFPHILLDNKRDNSIGRFEFDDSQRLKLEGDFNKYFNVYGPKEYEIEVLQVLNPSVMLTLLELPEATDIEIVGHELYIYNSGGYYGRKTIESLFTAIEHIRKSTAGVQKTFSMHEQIGDYRPILKKSKLPLVITLAIALAYLAFMLIAHRS